jgi:ankyrin repeat protein
MSSLEDFAEAIERGNSPIVESFISRDLVDVNVRLPRQNRPPALVHAARFGRKDVVDILLRANARVDETDERGWTACHVAALYNHRDVLELLLAHQPNVDVTDVGGKTAFFFAVRLSDEDASSCALMLLEAGASLERNILPTCVSSLRRARLPSRRLSIAASMCASCVFQMTARRCTWPHGVVAMRMCSRCSLRFVALIWRRVIVMEETCLHYAARRGNDFSLRWLLNAGADMNCVRRNGSTPLHDANFHSGAVILLAAGANVCARDNAGRTALHRVAAAHRNGRSRPPCIR